MKDRTLKWIYAFVMMICTIGWATFLVVYLINHADNPTTSEMYAASGAGALLGALIVWNGNINQHYFRKSAPPEPTPPPITTTPVEGKAAERNTSG